MYVLYLQRPCLHVSAQPAKRGRRPPNRLEERSGEAAARSRIFQVFFFFFFPHQIGCRRSSNLLSAVHGGSG